jgi:hypothetical protein
MVEMLKALLSFVEKLALVPLAPVPVLPYSSRSTLPVLGVLVLQTSHPALLIMAPRTVFWKHTRAYWLHGRPRYTVPEAAVDEVEVLTEDLLIT